MNKIIQNVILNKTKEIGSVSLSMGLSLRQIGRGTLCMRVRRDSDNTEQDIGFAGGILDIASLLSFVGSGSGFVHTWYDQIGANHYTQTDTTKQPRIVYNGMIDDGIIFSGAQYFTGSTASKAILNNAPGASIYMIARLNEHANTGAVAHPVILWERASSANRLAYTTKRGTSQCFTLQGQRLDTDSSEVKYGTGGLDYPIFQSSLIVNTPNTNVKFTKDGVADGNLAFGTAGNFAASNSANSRIGTSYQLNAFLKGAVYEILVVNRVLSVADDSIVTKNQIKHITSITPPPFIACVGDSLTTGSGTTDNSYTYPVVMNDNLASRYAVKKVATAGISIATMLANAPTNLYPLVNSKASKNIAIIWGGTNDLAGAATVNTTYANCVSLCEGAKAAGYKVIVATMLPRGTDSGVETKRIDYNDRIRTNYASFADVLMDVGSDADIGQWGSQDNTTYFYTDKIHLNNTGYGRIATYAANAVAALP